MISPIHYTGCVHIHSTCSDGSRPIDQIGHIADSVALDYIVITDHMTLDGLEYEGYYGNTLTLIGYEHHDAHEKNHYLGMNVCSVHTELTHPGAYVKAIEDDGGFGFVAHPYEKRKAISRYPAYPWEQWDIPGIRGIEIWNRFSDWMEHLTNINKIYRYLFPRRFLQPPPPEALATWDRLNRTRKVSAIGGIDAHAVHYPLLGLIDLNIFRYKIEFKSIRTHIISPEPFNRTLPHDRALVYGCLRNGNAYISNFRLGNAVPTDFRFEQGNASFHPGEEAVYCPAEPGTFRVSVPAEAELCLFHNGERFFSCTAAACSVPCRGPGNYRLEAFRNRKPWIYTNNIYVRAEGTVHASDRSSP